MDAAQRCQSCGYDLSQPPEPDLVQSCPECGAAYFPGEDPAPAWPGVAMVVLEGSSIFLVLLSFSAFLLVADGARGMGMTLLLGAALAGAIGAVRAGLLHGVRFTTRECRWKSRARIAMYTAGFEAAMLCIVWAAISAFNQRR